MRFFYRRILEERVKKDIEDYNYSLSTFKALKPRIFNWKNPGEHGGETQRRGFIAQELLALQKESNIGDNLDLVSEDNPEKLEARYGNLLPVIVKAIQEESAEKDKKINELRLEKDAEIDALKQRLDALEKRFNQMLTKSNK